MPLNVGLTGNIGSGKSTVARLFVKRGAALIDADVLAREATENPAVLRELASTFGEKVLRAGELDRKALAGIVFGNSEVRDKLNAIIHPWVARERERQVAALTAQLKPPAVIVHDIPLLFEVGLDAMMDRTVVVDAQLEVRLERVRIRSGLSEAEVRARDAAQLPLFEKVRRADFVIDNSSENSFDSRGAEGRLENQVDRVWAALLEEARKKGDR